MIRIVRVSLFAFLWVLCCAASDAPPRFERFFESRTMRVDYLHTGGPESERLTLDRVAADGDWAGSRTRLVDDTNLGDYLFEIVDRAAGLLIYSRGFGSIYGEWKTTPESRSRTRTFHESLRFPWPKAAVRIVVKKRDARNGFEQLWSADIDPRSASIVRTRPAASGKAWTLFQNGPAATRVDILLVGVGYGEADARKFHRDAARLVHGLFQREPFKSRQSDFNVRAIDLSSARPALTAEYNVFGLERYLLTYDNRVLRDVAASVPYDVIELLVNRKEYGGGGIFNAQGTVAVDNSGADYVFAHEFAHNFAALGDEYTGNVTYEARTTDQAEPWEPNLTALKAGVPLKWRDLVELGTPVPTPPEFAGKVGAFEGGGYQTRGIFRPESTCLMGSASTAALCRVCQRAVNRMIDMYVK